MRAFLIDIKRELKKVRWPNKKEMVNYSVATVFFIVFFALFFTVSGSLMGELYKVLMG